MCRLSVGNAVVPGGEHFPRKGAFVRLAGEKRTNNKVLLCNAPLVPRQILSMRTCDARPSDRQKRFKKSGIFSAMAEEVI